MVFAITAAEICIKDLILRPIVFGMVHQPYAAKFIADLAISQNGWDRFSKLLAEVLREKIGIDLQKVTRSGTSKPLWSECNRLQRVRNGVVHRGEEAQAEEAREAIKIAEDLQLLIFPQLVKGIGLRMTQTNLITKPKS